MVASKLSQFVSEMFNTTDRLMSTPFLGDEIGKHAIEKLISNQSIPAGDFWQSVPPD
jgi:hypothetical protein